MKRKKIFAEKGKVILEPLRKNKPNSISNIMIVLSDKKALKKSRDITKEGLKRLKQRVKEQYPKYSQWKDKVKKEFAEKDASIKFKHTPTGIIELEMCELKKGESYNDYNIKNNKKEKMKVLRVTHFYPRDDLLAIRNSADIKPAKREGIGIATINEIKKMAKQLKADYVVFGTPRTKASKLFLNQGFKDVYTKYLKPSWKYLKFKV